MSIQTILKFEFSNSYLVLFLHLFPFSKRVFLLSSFRILVNIRKAITPYRPLKENRSLS